MHAFRPPAQRRSAAAFALTTLPAESATMMATAADPSRLRRIAAGSVPADRFASAVRPTRRSAGSELFILRLQNLRCHGSGRTRPHGGAALPDVRTWRDGHQAAFGTLPSDCGDAKPPSGATVPIAPSVVAEGRIADGARMLSTPTCPGGSSRARRLTQASAAALHGPRLSPPTTATVDPIRGC